MQKVELFTRGFCPYCTRAKSLLGKKGIAFTDYEIDKNSELRPIMIERANGKTSVPQIFIGETHVGGCDELFALESAGKLDALLNA